MNWKEFKAQLDSTDSTGQFPDRMIFLVSLMFYACVCIYLSIGKSMDYSLLYPERTVSSIGFHFGGLIDSLIKGNGYKDCHQFETICFYTHRFPVIPLFIAGVSNISANIHFVFLLKNLVFFLFSWACFYKLAKTYDIKIFYFPLFLAAYVFIPLNGSVASSAEFEEGYSYHLLPFVFVFLVFMKNYKDILLLCLGTVLLFFLKSSLIAVCIPLVILAIFKGYKEKILLPSFIPATALILSALIWGYHSYNHTGNFVISSSFNGWNLYKGNNSQTHLYYPELHLDYLDMQGITTAEKSFRNEWELNSYYKKKAFDYIKEKPDMFVSNVLDRLNVAFLSVMKAGFLSDKTTASDIAIPDRSKISYEISGNMLLTRPILWTALITAFLMFYKAIANKKEWLPHFAFITLSMAHTAPFIAGFIYHRHIAPVLALSIMYIFYVLCVYCFPKRNFV